MDIKLICAGISIAISVVGYVFYFRDIFAGKTKPHAYTWLIWGLLTAIGFAAQISDNGGPGAYVTGATAFVSFIIFGLAIFKGEKDIHLVDKLYLGAALVAIVPWLLTDNALISVILIVIIDTLGFLPTIRKSYYKPYEETLAAYASAGIKFVFAIIALDNYSLITWLYPAVLIFHNLFFVPFLLIRRKQVGLIS